MKSEKIDVGLVGCGFIGTALKVWLEENNPNVILHISDPAKGYDENVYENEEIDAFFIQIHVPTLENGKQDIGVLEDIIRMIHLDSDDDSSKKSQKTEGNQRKSPSYAGISHGKDLY